MNFCEKKKIDLVKMQSFLEVLEKFLKICLHFGPPFPPAFPWFGMSCDVDCGTHNSRLDSFKFQVKFQVLLPLLRDYLQ